MDASWRVADRAAAIELCRPRSFGRRSQAAGVTEVFPLSEEASSETVDYHVAAAAAITVQRPGMYAPTCEVLMRAARTVAAKGVPTRREESFSILGCR